MNQPQPPLDFFFFSSSSVPPASELLPLQPLVELPAPDLLPLQALFPAHPLKVSADPDIRLAMHRPARIFFRSLASIVASCLLSVWISFSPGVDSLIVWGTQLNTYQNHERVSKNRCAPAGPVGITPTGRFGITSFHPTVRSGLGGGHKPGTSGGLACLRECSRNFCSARRPWRRV